MVVGVAATGPTVSAPYPRSGPEIIAFWFIMYCSACRKYSCLKMAPWSPMLDWKFIAEYSPYQNISTGVDYPPVLMTTSTRDDRVHPGHARKMTAALEAAGHRVWYYENIEGGHAGAADNAQTAFKSALSFAFLWRMLGA